MKKDSSTGWRAENYFLNLGGNTDAKFALGC